MSLPRFVPQFDASVAARGAHRQCRVSEEVHVDSLTFRSDTHRRMTVNSKGPYFLKQS